MKSDFSAFALWTAGLGWLTQAYAYTTPVGDTPTGNPIATPGLNDIVPVGSPYNITWDPTTSGTVTLVLLRGPSTNVVPLYPIVEKTENIGYYLWTPATDLEADTTHYGLQLIVDSDGSYQYSTQFGISNSASTSSSSGTVSATSSATASGTATSSVSGVGRLTSSNGTSTYANATTSAPTVASSGYASGSNVTLSKTMSVPSSLLTLTTTAASGATATGGSSSGGSSASGTSAAAAQSTGAAGRVDAGRSAGALMGALAAVVAFAL